MLKIIAPAFLALALAGCNATSLPSPAATNAALQTALAVAKIVSPASVARLDQSISQVAASPTMADSCAVFQVAAGYYTALRPGIPASYAKIGDPAVTAGADLCANPPADTAAALATLNRLWAGVQASTVAAQ